MKQPTEPTILNQDELLKKLNSCRLDRERLSVFQAYGYHVQLLEKVRL